MGGLSAAAARCGAAALSCLAALGCLLPAPGFASNGLNLIGFGAESLGMGGADLAVARDTSALNTNPAGLVQLPGERLDLMGTYAYQIEVGHRDRLGNDAEVANRHLWLAAAGLAGRPGHGPVTLGIGLFGQGGAGSSYEDLITPFGTRDDLSSLLRFAKVTPGVAWRVSDDLSLGASLQVVYADIRQEVFPDTSFFNAAQPAQSFFGIETSRLSGTGAGAKIGVQYRLGERATIGAAYTSRVAVDLGDGSLTTDMSAAGLGKVRYADARIEGLSLPREAGLGIALRPAKNLLLSAEVNWLDWSESIESSTLRATQPENPAAPPVLALASRHGWRDQWVYALGLAWEATEALTVRAGYNYGRSPIPEETLSPLLAVHAEHHVTLGGGVRLGARWRADLALEYVLPNSVTYDNPESLFGPGAEEVGESIACHIMLSRQW